MFSKKKTAVKIWTNIITGKQVKNYSMCVDNVPSKFNKKSCSKWFHGVVELLFKLKKTGIEIVRKTLLFVTMCIKIQTMFEWKNKWLTCVFMQKMSHHLDFTTTMTSNHISVHYVHNKHQNNIGTNYWPWIMTDLSYVGK